MWSNPWADHLALLYHIYIHINIKYRLNGAIYRSIYKSKTWRFLIKLRTTDSIINIFQTILILTHFYCIQLKQNIYRVANASLLVNLTILIMNLKKTHKIQRAITITVCIVRDLSSTTLELLSMRPLVLWYSHFHARYFYSHFFFLRLLWGNILLYAYKLFPEIWSHFI